MSKVLKIFKQHILYVANSIFGTIPYTHSLSSTFATFPKVFFVEGLKTEKKEHWRNKARMRFLWASLKFIRRHISNIYLKACLIALAYP